MKVLAAIPLLMSMQAAALEVSYGMGEQTFLNPVGFDQTGQIAACTIAENKALNDALVKFASRQFTSIDQTVCHNEHCDYIREIDSSVAGSVKNIVQRDKKVENNTCFVKVVAEIEPAKQIPADVNAKRIYRPGDLLWVDIDIEQPLYLHVWNFHKWGAQLVFPNRLHMDSLIDETFDFPGDGSLYASLPDGASESKETLLFVFTKKRQHFPDVTLHKNDLKQILDSIPTNDKRIIQQNIVIRGNW